MSRTPKFLVFLLSTCLLLPLGGCPKASLPPPAIDLAQVNAAFQSTSGTTFQEWMQNFEQAVNEIYMMNDVVFVDARRPFIGKMRIYGYLNRDGRPGYRAGRDRLLFQIAQYQGAQQFNYALMDGSGWVYRRSYYRRSGLGTFAMYAFIGAALWRPYYTPRSRVMVIRRYRTRYRSTAAYKTRRASYRSFRKSTRAARRSYRSSRRSARRSSYRSRSGSRSSRGYRSSRSSGGKW